MDLLSFFKGGKYFDKNIAPKCDYCQFGKRAKDGNKVLCEKRGLVDCNYSCNKFAYSPLKRIPVKQLNFVGSLADEDIYIESAGDRAEKEAEKKAQEALEKKEAEKKTFKVAADKKADDQRNPAPGLQPIPPIAPIQQTVPVQQPAAMQQSAPAQQQVPPVQPVHPAQPAAPIQPIPPVQQAAPIQQPAPMQQSAPQPVHAQQSSVSQPDVIKPIIPPAPEKKEQEVAVSAE